MQSIVRNNVPKMTVEYKGLSTTITDPDGNKKTEKKDYLGRVIQVTEYYDPTATPPVIYTTSYTYNAAGDLRLVTDHYGNTTEMKYDTLGRKTGMDDPDMGRRDDPADNIYAWQYCYDPNGNLLRQMDTKGQIIIFTYDAGNRVKTKAYYKTDNPTSAVSLCSRTDHYVMANEYPVTYTYDNLTISNGKGRPYSVSNTKATTTYKGYDALGRVTSSTKTIQGDVTQYTTATAYDYSGKPTVMTYPDLTQVTNTYHPGSGLLYSVGTYATMTNYEPTGKIGKLVQNGDKTTTTYTYDVFSTRLLTMIAKPTTAGNDPLTHIINRSYVYSKAGNINTITDKKKGKLLGISGDAFTYTYTYDRLHRFTNETTTNNVYNPVAYTYNAIGNILSKAVGSTSLTRLDYTYDPIKIHAVKTIQVNNGTIYNFGYDLNGNMTSGYDLTDLQNISARTITYNADNMPVQVTHARYGTTNISYDGTSNRVKKISPSGAITYYVGEHYEVKNNEPVKYIFAGNLRIAKVAPTGTYFFHKDHLGSTTAMTTDTGTVVETNSYMPFGEMRENAGIQASNYLFTDQEFDPETGLYYYGARYYDPTIGRFISPDSIVPSPYDPQTLNRYTYCRNNPIIYTDPSGHNPILIGMLIGAIMGAVSAAINGGNILEGAFIGAVTGALAGGIGSAIGGAVGGLVGSTLVGNIVGGAVGGAIGGTMYAAAYGGNIAQGALFGAIGGAIAGAVGGINFDGIGGDPARFAAQVASAGVTSGVLAELSGAKFSQGAIPAMISAAAVSIAQMSMKQSQGKGFVSESNAQNKATSDLVVRTSANGESQVYGKGPESCGYWGELAQNTDDLLSRLMFKSTQGVCIKAGTPPVLNENWDRWVRACLQDVHELYSRYTGISRYTYTVTEFLGGHAVCLPGQKFFGPTNPPTGVTQ